MSNCEYSGSDASSQTKRWKNVPKCYYITRSGFVLLLANRTKANNNYSHHLQNGSGSNRVSHSQQRQFLSKKRRKFLEWLLRSWPSNSRDGNADIFRAFSRNSSYLIGRVQIGTDLFISEKKSPTQIKVSVCHQLFYRA